jgi:plastocyanin
VRKLLPLVLVIAVGGVFAAQALAATKTVKVGDNWFVRDSGTTPTVNAKRGDKVRWRFVGRAPHNVTVRSGPVKFRSGNKNRGQTYTRTMSKRGTYRILCTIHGPTQSMRLVVS